MASENARTAATAIATGLAKEAGVAICEEPAEGCELVVNSRLVALIAYLQRLGRIPSDDGGDDAWGGQPVASASSEGGRR